MGENGSMAFLKNRKKGPAVSVLIKNGWKGPMVFQLNGKKGPNAFLLLLLIALCPESRWRPGTQQTSKSTSREARQHFENSLRGWTALRKAGRWNLFPSTFTFLIYAFFLLFKRWTTRRDQEREIIGPASLLQSWHRVLFYQHLTTWCTFEAVVHICHKLPSP